MSEHRIREQEDAVSLMSDDSDDKELNLAENQKNTTALIRTQEKKSKAIVN